MGMKASNVKLTRRALKLIFRVTEIAAQRDRSKKKSMNYGKLFEPGKIGKLTLKYRFIVGAMGVGFAELGGSPTDRTVEYYGTRARGGWARIITEVTRVQDTEFCTPFEPSPGNDKFIPAWKKVTDAVHAEGAYIFPQFHQPGRQYTKAFSATR